MQSRRIQMAKVKKNKKKDDFKSTNLLIYLLIRQDTFPSHLLPHNLLLALSVHLCVRAWGRAVRKTQFRTSREMFCWRPGWPGTEHELGLPSPAFPRRSSSAEKSALSQKRCIIWSHLFHVFKWLLQKGLRLNWCIGSCMISVSREFSHHRQMYREGPPLVPFFASIPSKGPGNIGGLMSQQREKVCHSIYLNILFHQCTN